MCCWLMWCLRLVNSRWQWGQGWALLPDPLGDEGWGLRPVCGAAGARAGGQGGSSRGTLLMLLLITSKMPGMRYSLSCSVKIYIPRGSMFRSMGSTPIVS